MEPWHAHAYSFPGFGFLLAQLTYRFVPYGDYLLTFVLLAVLLSSTARWVYRVLSRLSRNRV
jgi:hypothetical protein